MKTLRWLIVGIICGVLITSVLLHIESTTDKLKEKIVKVQVSQQTIKNLSCLLNN